MLAGFIKAISEVELDLNAGNVATYWNCKAAI